MSASEIGRTRKARLIIEVVNFDTENLFFFRETLQRITNLGLDILR